MSTSNRQITLAVRPVGMPKESDFHLTEAPMPRPLGGEVLVRSLYLSVDPYMRGRLSGITTYAKGLQPGEVIVGAVVGRVVESNDPRYAPDEIVEGMLGWQEYAVAPAKALRKVSTAATRSSRREPVSGEGSAPNVLMIAKATKWRLLGQRR